MTKILQTNVLLVAINFIVIYSVVNGSAPVVKIGNGKLIGTTYTLPNGRVVNAFYGIPYAAPPIGYLRFEVSNYKSENVCMITVYYGNVF